MNATPQHLFVYGTLRAASSHPMAAFLAARGRRVGAGRVHGRLYDLGDFPGLVPSEGEWVRGEVHELEEPGATLAALDRYEGCAEGEPRPWLYERVLADVTLDGGGLVRAWVYCYRGPLDKARPIASGDYLADRRAAGA